MTIEDLHVKTSNEVVEFMKQLYIENEGDVTIQVADNSKFKVISHILKQKSKIFYNMFSNDMLENINKKIDMMTYNPTSVRIFFAYFYYHGVYDGKDIDIYFELLCLSEQYGQKDYFAHLQQNIMNLIKDENIDYILEKCREHGDICNKIYERCIKHLCRHRLNCYDDMSDDTCAWCCKHKIKRAPNRSNDYQIYNGSISCSYYTATNNLNKDILNMPSHVYTGRCCLHRKRSVTDYDAVKDMDLKIKDDILKYLFS